MKTYRLTYEYYDQQDNLIAFNKIIKVKKCLTPVGAKIKLERYLKQKHDNFGRLVVYSCDEEKGLDFLDIFDIFSK